MRIVITRSARRDLRWWGRYYRVAFPQGAENAARHLDRIAQTLAANPFLGRAIENSIFRQVQISNTPFALIYAVSPTRIEIVRVWDMRQKPNPGFQED